MYVSACSSKTYELASSFNAVSESPGKCLQNGANRITVAVWSVANEASKVGTVSIMKRQNLKILNSPFARPPGRIGQNRFRDVVDTYRGIGKWSSH